MRNTPFLILDEALSAVDRQNRVKIMQSIKEWRAGKTTVIITHELSQIPPDDMVYFLNEGTVVECGLRSVLEEKDDGYLKQFLNTSHLEESDSIIEQGDPDSSGKQLPISTGYATGVDSRIVSEQQYGAAQEYHHHRRKVSAWIPDVPSHNSIEKFRPIININPDPDTKKASTGDDTKSSFFSWPFHTTSGNKGKENFTLYDIFLTVWPSLRRRYRLSLIIGFITAFIHAIDIPMFSLALSNLLTLFCSPTLELNEFKRWALVVIGIAAIDGIATYLMQYLLESVSQEWVDTQRIEAFRRITYQPVSWFEDPSKGVSGITEDLEKNAEEMKALLGRFSGSILVGTVMTTVSLIWALIECVHLTAVVTVLVPIMFVVSIKLSRLTDKCEENYTQTEADTGATLMEAIENVVTVKLLRLEGYFQKRHGYKVNVVFNAGLQRCVWGGCSFAMNESFMLFALSEYLLHLPSE